MDLDGEFELEHILFSERKCRSCGITKNLLDDFYRTRKSRGVFPSSYSYECKECTKKRIVNNRKSKPTHKDWEYPDW